MASRSRVEFNDREYYREGPGGRREETDVYERQERRTSRSAAPPVREYDDVDIRISERDRLPAFLREERRAEPGQLVLRQREVETIDRERPRRRSPSPVRLRTHIVERARSVSPAPPPRRVEEDVRIRTVERVREPSRAPSERIRTRIVERERERSPSPSPPPVERIRTRIVERPRSPSPMRERIRIIERKEERAPSPAPPPPPQVVKGPIIEREVITHYRDIDHGIVAAPRPPSPPPPRRQQRERDTEIDIYTSRNQTDIDIHKHSSRSRGRSHSRERPSPHIQSWDDEVLINAERRHLHVDIDAHRSTSRRAHSAAPPVIDYDDEARQITRKIDSRGRMGEAHNGITKDWTIVDVPPGTERVRMDGAGGASAEVTWQKYSGVRRSKFIPDRDERSTAASSSTSLSERDQNRDSRLSVQIYNDSRDREREIDIEKVTDRRISIRDSGRASPAPRRNEMWTEITKDLVTREAIDELGYEYEETEWFFYIMQYLRYDDVLQLVQLSEAIRRARKDRAREIQWEREYRDDYDRDYHAHVHRHRHSVDQYDDERIVEREIVYENRPSRSYHH
ncbi:hypothetical protein B0T19DRAFT_7873 [Cercophora scortea]|uniref:DUF8035 domain-containing protein n=1 Tax=Cercophora scortea TaxID=314031 RepID=A0AAE0J1Z5_9PEZI|nr:hypothetical protein B0T19DRAFT_7873 [Cercophora scortea]